MDENASLWTAIRTIEQMKTELAQLRAELAALREQEPVGAIMEVDPELDAKVDGLVDGYFANQTVQPMAPQPAIPEGWHGHKFKEVKKGRWKCDCGKEIVEQTQYIPEGLVQAIVESVAEFVEIQQGGPFSPAVIGAAIRGKNTYSSLFYKAMLAAQQEAQP